MLLTSWGGFHGLSMCFSSLYAIAWWPSLHPDLQGLTAFGEWLQGMERCSGSQPVHPILL